MSVATACTSCGLEYRDDLDNRPLILPCRHTFCQGCVNDLTSGSLTKCIECGRHHKLGASGFPINKLVLAGVDSSQPAKTRPRRTSTDNGSNRSSSSARGHSASVVSSSLTNGSSRLPSSLRRHSGTADLSDKSSSSSSLPVTPAPTPPITMSIATRQNRSKTPTNTLSQAKVPLSSVRAAAPRYASLPRPQNKRSNLRALTPNTFIDPKTEEIKKQVTLTTVAIDMVPGSSRDDVDGKNVSSSESSLDEDRHEDDNEDETCGGCQEESRSLEHCSHCGQPVCDKCKSEHKMQVLERLHMSRAYIEEKISEMKSEDEERECTIQQLNIRSEEEIAKIRSNIEKTKLILLEELDKRKEILIDEVRVYVHLAAEALSNQTKESQATVSEVSKILEKADSSKDSETLSKYDVLDLCQTQIKYAKGIKQLEKMTKKQTQITAAMPKFNDEEEAVALLNLATTYGALVGCSNLENNLELTEKFARRSFKQMAKKERQRDPSVSAAPRVLHRYRTIINGSAIHSFVYRKGNKDSKLIKNEKVCVLRDGRIAISCCDTQTIKIYNKNYEMVRELKVDQFQSLQGLSASATHLILLVRNSLEMYLLEKNSMKLSGKFLGNSELINPCAVSATDSKIYVYDQDTDRNLHFINIFDASGKFQSKKFLLEAKQDRTISLVASSPKGSSPEEVQLIVGSSKGIFLRVYDGQQVQLIREFNTDEPKVQGRKWRPSDVMADAEGNVLVLDTSGRKVMIFTKEGTFSSQFDPFSVRSGHASKLAICADGRILILDTTNGKCQIF